MLRSISGMKHEHFRHDGPPKPMPAPAPPPSHREDWRRPHGAEGTDPDYLWSRRHRVLSLALINRRYQMARWRVMESRERWVKVASLAAGSATLTQLSNPQAVAWLAAIVVVASMASLVFGWGAKARDAAQRAGAWLNLLMEIEQCGERSFTEDQLNSWDAGRRKIEHAEPPANERLLMACQYDVELSLGQQPTFSRPVLPALMIH